MNDNESILGSSLPSDRSQAIKIITEAYLDQLDLNDYHAPEEISNDIVAIMKQEFAVYNDDNATPGAKWRIPDSLSPAQIARIMLKLYNIKNINCAGANMEKEYDILAIYREKGYNAGIYDPDETAIRNIVRQFNFSLNSFNIQEVINILRDQAERVERCNDRDLIAVNNGIFNYKTKELSKFSPDIVFISKSHINYVPTAVSPVIRNDKDNTDWEVTDWINSLFPDGSDIPETIWQIIGATLRPNVRWGKAAWFYSTQGNNGKGCICQLIRNILGEGTYASIPLADFGKDFLLEPLIKASAIITDENDVGTYVDKAANLKAIITNDVIQINRKFKVPIAYQFKGFMIQCLNEKIRTKDKSESFYRRQLVIPFSKCYTGIERKYIKNDYLNRKEVLQYILYKVLNMNYYEITEPDVCKDILEEMKIYNDPVRDFLNDILPRASWECLNSVFLYHMYQNWCKKNNPNGLEQGRKTFLDNVANIIQPEKDGWRYVKSDRPERILDRMDGSEPLVQEFCCDEWFKEFQKKSPKSCGGLFKIENTSPQNISSDENEDDSVTSE